MGIADKAILLRRACGLAVIAMLALAAGCASPITRPPGVQCAAFLHEADGGTAAAAAIDRLAGMRAGDGASPRDVVINVLALSGGGKYGAYGAGFLSGWSDAEREGTRVIGLRRDQIDIVTGISTGSLLATYAAVGNAAPAGTPGQPDPVRADADDAMRAAYQTSDAQLFTQRGLIGSLGSNGLADVSGGLARRVDEMAARYRDQMRALPPGRAVLIGVVNLSNGRFYVADLVEIARSDAANAADCYREILLASSAVPVQFAPRYIDGHPYVDGGVRFGAFLGRAFEQVAERRTRRGDPLENRALKVNLRVIVNGTLSANSPTGDPGARDAQGQPINYAARAAACDAAALDQIASACPPGPDDLLSIAKRSAGDVLADQIYRDSVFRLQRELEALGILGSSRFTYVPNAEIAAAGCRNATRDNFDRAFMDCLSGIGRAKGARQAWDDFTALPRVRDGARLTRGDRQ